ncbi:hypothetical protein EMIT0P171_150167 [Pseudomonas sp. IT-P171]
MFSITSIGVLKVLIIDFEYSMYERDSPDATNDN